MKKTTQISTLIVTFILAFGLFWLLDTLQPSPDNQVLERVHWFFLWLAVCGFLSSAIGFFLFVLIQIFDFISRTSLFKQIVKLGRKTDDFFSELPAIIWHIFVILSPFLIVGFVVGSLIVFIFPREQWKGFFYQNRYDLTEHVETGTFNSLEECRDHTIAYGEDRGIPISQFDYECGLNCKSQNGGFLCKETLR